MKNSGRLRRILGGRMSYLLLDIEGEGLGIVVGKAHPTSNVGSLGDNLKFWP